MKTRKAWIAVAVVGPLALAVTGAAAYIFGGAYALRHSLREYDYLIGFKNYEQCSLTLHDLGLSEPQAQQYRAIGDAARPELNNLRDRIREKKADVLRLLQSRGSDTAAIARVLDEITPLQAALERKTIEYIVRLRTVLADRQVARYDRMTRRAVCPWL